MESSESHGLLSPPASAASPAASGTSYHNRTATLPTPRSHPLRPGSQKEIALINYLDDRILRISRRYAKKFSDEGLQNDDTPGYTTYDEFVADADPLVDVVWVSGTPTIQIPYLLTLAGLVCSYLQAFPFSMSFFYIVAKLDQGFVALLQPSENGSAPGATSHSVSTTEKVRIKSLVEETRVAAVRAASASGHQANIHDISEVDTTDEDEDQEDNDGDDGGDLDSDSISLGIAKVYKRTLEILGDSLVSEVLSQHEGAITETSRDEMRDG
ncbi:hypothetical protein HRR83_008065 [Exophiala dermatitidis]|uniref:Uncharacterized protein n=2 Tax=Exophiala dermatitidis TaxID=5970 RepID=H6BTF5_EXODN|nr:uncharacterized protein HMPREF1120_02522 [Exophiala dermatitidis NIH/UT8656]KAJ4503316.1 hypothetical protein HRR75_008099 [Exophiala dermatitidis]EHY54352.1 hypothetical protein HMPREF1120_02522 [Exophiala dermatitidis NIH/UT8656]KAJ4504987.1 hypothetical protein HRR74_008815 [Exophiala dermatitidis]KAJ4513495.1 hypothetical protein HRR73_005653 [Exophiala dermatitidis]KAJ4535729.1 hypothetical protein HRR77_007676 [Exophiala dermatitidis]